MIELIVSVGILGILLVVAGGVFTLTLKSSGQANALIEVSEQIRALEETLAADLRNVQPGRSIMIIQPNVIHAAWTSDQLELGDDAERRSDRRDPERERINSDGDPVRDLPRADVIGIFTDRPATSVRDPKIVGQTQFVVYGHAQIGEFDLDPTKVGRWIRDPSLVWRFDDFRFREPATASYSASTGYYSSSGLQEPLEEGHTPFPIPASDWHLARRAVVIADRNLSASDNPPHYPAATLNDSPDGISGMGIASIDNDPLYSSSALPSANYLRDGRRDYIVNGSAGFDYEVHVTRRQDRNVQDVWNPHQRNPRSDTDVDDPHALIHWIGRAQLAASPRANQSGRLGAYFLPNCANFKVEWALDTSDVDYGPLRGTRLPGASEVIWIDPVRLVEQVHDMQPIFVDFYDNVCGEMFSSMPDVLRCQETVVAAERKVIGKLVPGNPVANPEPHHLLMQQQIQFCLDEHGPSRFVDPGKNGTSQPAIRSMHIFYPYEPLPSCYYDDMVDPLTGLPKHGATAPPDLPDPLFPKAVRITVDIYDAGRRLERPIRHVMVLPVGQN